MPNPTISSDELWNRKLTPFLELFDALGRRWSLRILWELRDGALTFRALREQSGAMSSSVLSERLRELRAANVIVHDPTAGGYQLSPIGDEVVRRIADLYFTLEARDDWPVHPRAAGVQAGSVASNTVKGNHKPKSSARL